MVSVTRKDLQNAILHGEADHLRDLCAQRGDGEQASDLYAELAQLAVEQGPNTPAILDVLLAHVPALRGQLDALLFVAVSAGQVDCSGLIELDTLIRDNKRQQLRCRYESEKS